MTAVVAFARRPFGQDLWRGVALEGATLAEIAAEVPGLPARFWNEGRICINGDAVPRELWQRVRPRSDARVPVGVTLHLPMGDGGSGGGGGDAGKQAIGIVASIALLAATAFVGAGFGAGIAGGWFTSGSLSAKVLAAGLGLGGALAINAIFAPSPKIAASQTAAARSSGDDIATAGFDQNVVAKGGYFPHVVGTRRVAPGLVTATPLTEIVGNDEYVEGEMALAGPHAMSDPRIGDTLSDDLADVEIEMREGWASDPPITLVTRQGYEDPVNITLSDHAYDPDTTYLIADQDEPGDSLPIWHKVQLRAAPDEIWLTLYWIEGFFDESTADDQRIPLRLRMRLVGETEWLNLPELHFIGHRQALVRKTIKLMWQAAPVIPSPPTAEGPVAAYRSVPVQTVAGGPASGGWTAHAFFGTGAIDDADNVALYGDRVEIYLDAATFPKGTYEVEVTKGQTVLDSAFTPSTYSYSGIGIPDLFGYYLAGGQARTVQEQGDLHGRVALVRVASVWREPPLQVDDGLAKVAIRVKNRSITNVSVIASGYVRDYVNGEWGTWLTTGNPAAHFRAALIGPLNRKPLRPRQIDEESLIAWRSFCATQGYTCNAILQGGSLDEALRTIAAAGHATLRAMPYGVAWEYDRSGEDPIQTFSPRNSTGHRFEKAYPRLPDGFLVTFADASQNYQPREIVVLRDGVDGNAADLLLEAVQYEQIVDEANVRIRARLDLRQAELRAVEYAFDADIESILCRRGDLIALQNDIIDRQAGFARVARVIVDADLVVGLDLDQEIRVASDAGDLTTVADLTAVADVTVIGARTGVSVRLDDGAGTILTREIAPPSGSFATVAFATPFARPAGLEEGCQVVSGRLGSTYRRTIVKSVTPKKDFAATVVVVDEAPGIHPLAA